MDIARFSTDMAEIRLADDVQTGMLKRAIEQMEQTGAQIVEMMNAAKLPEKGKIDIKV